MSEIVAIFTPDRCQPPIASKARMSFDNVTLKAGTNQLTSEQLEVLRKHPDYPRFERLKAIELVGKPDIVDISEAIELSQFSIEDAQRIISASSDITGLTEALQKETRAKVRATLTIRVNELNSGVI